MKSFILTVFITLSGMMSAQNYNFLGNYSSNGTPLYLEVPGDQISEESLNLIYNALPEGYPVPDFNPQYITSGYDTDISLNEDADIWVTFVHEGAGYRNVLGFYTYPTGNNPGETPSAEEITIIFPNVSAYGSGGSLKPGDKVHLGTFEAGTSIGWVLLANGWNGQKVTSGNAQLFSNTDYNPEAVAFERQHNVLLNDVQSERIFLGFEDIRRDYYSCDNDFNDAIFFVTANPHTAIETENLTDIRTATDVTSSYNGGLESHGDLSALIAKRNFSRSKSNTDKAIQAIQPLFDASKTITLKSAGLASLSTFIPKSGLLGTEIAREASPQDLIGITNALEVFSVDYYLNNQRVSAILGTQTKGAVYDHTKVICDRLNGSQIKDIRPITVKGYQIIGTTIERAEGQIEYAVSFSVKTNGEQDQLYSFWGTNQYPFGDYYNFQIWGSSYAQVFALVNQVLDKFNAHQTLLHADAEPHIPDVFIQSGKYENGKVVLNIRNNTGSKELIVNGSLAASETSERSEFLETIELSGERSETIEINTGSLFDAGLSIATQESVQTDAVYLADGPWGIDFLEEEVELTTFTVEASTPLERDGTWVVERMPLVKGKLLGTLNLFRQVLPGNQSLSLDSYSEFTFSIQNSHPVEVIIMTSDLSTWENRARVKIPANATEQSYTFQLSDFKDRSGNIADIKDVNRVVFSTQGNFATSEDFNISVNYAAFKNNFATGTNDIQNLPTKISNYPNPFDSETHIMINQEVSQAVIKVYTPAGNLVDTQLIKGSKNEGLLYNVPLIQSGVYIYKLILDEKSEQFGTFIIR